MPSTVDIPPPRLTSLVADELAWSPEVCVDQIDAAVRPGMRVRGVAADGLLG